MVTESGHVVLRVHRKQICVTSLNEFQESLLTMAPWQEPKAIDSLVTGKCGVRVAGETARNPLQSHGKLSDRISVHD